MAQNTHISIPGTGWVLLTDSDVTAATVQNVGGGSVYIQATVGAVEPTVAAGSVLLQPGQAIAADMSLADLFPGVSGATRIWASSSGGLGTIMMVSHA